MKQNELIKQMTDKELKKQVILSQLIFITIGIILSIFLVEEMSTILINIEHTSPQHRDGGTSVTTAAAGHGVPERFENPGLAPHRERLSDKDPVAAKRAEWQVAIIFLISILATVGGVVGFYAVPAATPYVGFVRLSHLSLGLGLGLGVLGDGVGALHSAK